MQFFWTRTVVIHVGLGEKSLVASVLTSGGPGLTNVGLVLIIIITRRLATVNKSRVNICGRPCINLSHIQFDHHAKYGCCFSYCVRPCSRSQKCWGRWVPGLSDGGVADPWKHASPHLCHHTKFGCNKKNCVGTGRIPKIAALGCHMADPLETTILHLCYRTKFGLSVLVSLDVGRGSQKIWRTLDQAPLGRGRG